MQLKRIAFNKNPAFCIAPFSHTYISPQSERRLCCASREVPQYTRQYIDLESDGAKDEVAQYIPKTLSEHWNSDFMRRIRRQMLAGEMPKECQVCNEQLLNLHTYKKYFNETLFPDLIEQAYAETDDDGCTKLSTVSFDYRVSNLCDFKCRMCGPQLSSKWQSEKMKHASPNESLEPWMVSPLNAKIGKFQREVVEVELVEAAKSGELRELYWVGGEPLIWPLHWQVMQQLIDDGLAGQVFVRYNTNLNNISFKGKHLFDDILPAFKGYNVCASIDATSGIGEFIRTGLNWSHWLENFKTGLPYISQRGDNSLVFDLTITLPGLLDIKNLADLANELGVKIYTKIVFDFDASVVLSPFALPKKILNPLLQDLIDYLEVRNTKYTRDLYLTLVEMRNRPCFDEKYQNHSQQLADGKRHHQKLAVIRGDGEGRRMKIEDIYKMRPDILAWWQEL